MQISYSGYLTLVLSVPRMYFLVLVNTEILHWVYCISCCSSENSCNISSLKTKSDKKYPDFKLKEWFSGVIQENPPLSPLYPPVEGGKPAANERIFSWNQAPSQAQCLLALPALRILAIYFSSSHVWHTGDKGRIHSRPAKEVDFSNMAINPRQKIFGADFGFVKKRR